VGHGTFDAASSPWTGLPYLRVLGPARPLCCQFSPPTLSPSCAGLGAPAAVPGRLSFAYSCPFACISPLSVVGQLVGVNENARRYVTMCRRCPVPLARSDRVIDNDQCLRCVDPCLVSERRDRCGFFGSPRGLHLAQPAHDIGPAGSLLPWRSGSFVLQRLALIRPHKDRFAPKSVDFVRIAAGTCSRRLLSDYISGLRTPICLQVSSSSLSRCVLPSLALPLCCREAPSARLGGCT